MQSTRSSAKDLSASKKPTRSISNKFLEVFSKRLNVTTEELGKILIESMLECFPFEVGFTCTFVSKTNKKCYKKATNKEQTYCNLHARYGDPNKKIINGQPCSYLMQFGKNKGQPCGKVGREVNPGVYLCDGHSKTLNGSKSQAKAPGPELKLGLPTAKVELDPTVPLKTINSGLTIIDSSTYEIEF